MRATRTTRVFECIVLGVLVGFAYLLVQSLQRTYPKRAALAESRLAAAQKPGLKDANGSGMQEFGALSQETDTPERNDRIRASLRKWAESDPLKALSVVESQGNFQVIDRIDRHGFSVAVHRGLPAPRGDGERATAKRAGQAGSYSGP